MITHSALATAVAKEFIYFKNALRNYKARERERQRQMGRAMGFNIIKVNFFEISVIYAMQYVFIYFSLDFFFKGILKIITVADCKTTNARRQRIIIILIELQFFYSSKDVEE